MPRLVAQQTVNKAGLRNILTILFLLIQSTFIGVAAPREHQRSPREGPVPLPCTTPLYQSLRSGIGSGAWSGTGHVKSHRYRDGFLRGGDGERFHATKPLLTRFRLHGHLRVPVNPPPNVENYVFHPFPVRLPPFDSTKKTNSRLVFLVEMGGVEPPSGEASRDTATIIARLKFRSADEERAKPGWPNPADYSTDATRYCVGSAS